MRLSPADSLDASIARTTSDPFELPHPEVCEGVGNCLGRQEPLSHHGVGQHHGVPKGMVRAQSCSVRVTVVTGMGVPGIVVTSPESRADLCRRIRPRSEEL